MKKTLLTVLAVVIITSVILTGCQGNGTNGGNSVNVDNGTDTKTFSPDVTIDQTVEPTTTPQTTQSQPQAQFVKTVVVDKLNKPYNVDLDGDGKNETLEIKEDSSEFSEELCVVTDSNGNEIYSHGSGYYSQIWIFDLIAGDNKLEFAFIGDTGSADYETKFYSYSNGAVSEIQVKGTLGEGDGTSYYGSIAEVKDGKIILEAVLDVFGTNMATAEFGYDGRSIVNKTNGEWFYIGANEPFDEYDRLMLKRAVTAYDLNDPSKTFEVAVDTKIKLTSTDAKSFVKFITYDGAKGLFKIEPLDGFGFSIGGVEENMLFYELPYAG